jgi:SAM-dependent methyltransferase
MKGQARELQPRCPVCEENSFSPYLASEEQRLLICRFCGMVVMDPQPEESVGIFYDTLYRDEEARVRVASHRMGLYEYVLDLMGPEKGRRLLDVGCGTGEFLRLAGSRGWWAYGIDPVIGAVEQVKDEPRVRAYLGSLPSAGVTDMSFPSAFFDLVTLWNVLDYVPQPLATLREIRRTVKPDGFLFVRVPNLRFHVTAYFFGRLLGWVPGVRGLAAGSYTFHPLIFSQRTLRELLRRAGYDRIVLWPSPLSRGDPYRILPRRGESVIQAVKLFTAALDRMVYRLSRKALIIGPSIAALARRPRDSGADC